MYKNTVNTGPTLMNPVLFINFVQIRICQICICQIRTICQTCICLWQIGIWWHLSNSYLSNSYLTNLHLSHSYYLSNMYLFVTNRNLMAGYKWQCVRRAGPLFTVLSYVIHVTYVNCYALGNNIHTQPLWFSVSKGWSYKTSRFFPSFFAQLPMAIYRKRFKRFTWNLVC